MIRKNQADAARRRIQANRPLTSEEKEQLQKLMAMLKDRPKPDDSSGLEVPHLEEKYDK